MIYLPPYKPTSDCYIIIFHTKSKYTEEQQRAAIAGDIYDWGRESAANSKCIYDVKPGDKLGHDFILKYKPLAEEQLAKAGYRLAKVLNDIFDRQ